MTWSPTSPPPLGSQVETDYDVSISSKDAADTPISDQVRRMVRPAGSSPHSPILTSSGSLQGGEIAFEGSPEGRARRVASALATNPRYLLTVLAFVAQEGTVPVDALLEGENRQELFEAVFDLYDAALLKRDGARVTPTESGRAVLKRAGLL